MPTLFRSLSFAALALASTLAFGQPAAVLQAANQGDADAQFNLGWMHDKGEGVPQNHALAASLYRKAADQGDAKAQFILGLMHAKGEGVPQNYEDAYFWLSLASAQNASHAPAKDRAAALLSPAQLARVQARSAGWQPAPRAEHAPVPPRMAR